jgi:lipid II isoglutaminyl synthase (glutamine-hydrolysing)
MRTRLAIWAGKTSGAFSRMFGKSGSSIPGVMARKLDHHFLRHLRKNAKTIVYVTGTNGKTTTTNLLAHLLKASGKSVIANLEGSNLITGLSTVIVRNATLFGWKENDVAVLEVDEASLPKTVTECPPDYLIVTNFFRDQLDRYGEVDTLIQKMKDSLAALDVKLILNADDPFVHRFSDLMKDNVYIGIDADACKFPSYQMSESRYCPLCQNELTYHVTHYGQLGDYECSCGFSRPQPNFSAELVKQRKSGIQLIVNGESYQTNLNGLYNSYNALLAISVCKLMGMDPKKIQKGLTSYSKTEGRMQVFRVGLNAWKLNLVKNPAGGNVTLFEFIQSPEKKLFMFCLNDNLADGEDISWIWDIDMEAANREDVQSFIASGKRAYDAALRMKYAGIPEEKISILPDMKDAVALAKSKDLPTYIMATYTCLAPMISLLSFEEENSIKGEKIIESSTLPFLPGHAKPVRGQRKRHIL